MFKYFVHFLALLIFFILVGVCLLFFNINPLWLLMLQVSFSSQFLLTHRGFNFIVAKFIKNFLYVLWILCVYFYLCLYLCVPLKISVFFWYYKDIFPYLNDEVFLLHLHPNPPEINTWCMMWGWDPILHFFPHINSLSSQYNLEQTNLFHYSALFCDIDFIYV